MPYTTLVPPFVLPDSDEGRDYYNYYIKGQEEESTEFVGWCPDWKDSGAGVYESVDEERPNSDRINACRNRRSDGVRTNNWCFRCPAGYPFIALHIYDAERESDRSIDLGL